MRDSCSSCLRMAFWLRIVLILLPGAPHRGPSTSEVGAADAISAASATVHDLKGFCTREPDACTVGSEFATSMGYRAQAGAKMLYDFLTEALASHETTSRVGEPIKSAANKPLPQSAGIAEHADPRRPGSGLARAAGPQNADASSVIPRRQNDGSQRTSRKREHVDLRVPRSYIKPSVGRPDDGRHRRDHR